MVVLSREDTQDLMDTAPHLPRGSMVVLPKGNMVLHLPKDNTVLLRRGNTKVIIPPLLLRILRPELLQATMLLLRLAVPQLEALLVLIKGPLHKEGLTKPLPRPHNTSRPGHQAMVQRVDRVDRVDMVGIRLPRLD